MDAIKFYFDPRCTWTYQASRWIRRLEELGVVETDWGVYSLEIANAPEGTDPRTIDAESGPVLRTAMVIMERYGSKAIGPFYKAVGHRMWEQVPPVFDGATAVKESLEEIGLEPGILDEAMADPASWDAVIAEHRALLADTRTVGVPTIILDGGEGPAIFGPVISLLPEDDDAVAMWEHLRWLCRYENFSELKRERLSAVVLPAKPAWNEYRKQQREQAAGT